MSDEPTDPRWPATWTRAALGTAILAAVEDRPLHGYGIAGSLERRGFGRPKGGSLYPLLASLEDDGALAAAWQEGTGGPGRRTYTLTAAGHRRLDRERDDWDALAAALRRPEGGQEQGPEGEDRDGDA